MSAAKRVQLTEAPKPEPVTSSVTQSVERRKGVVGTEMRATMVLVRESGETVNLDTGWRDSQHFFPEYMLLHQELQNFLVGDVGRPVIG
jgi:hypothetical protein